MLSMRHSGLRVVVLAMVMSISTIPAGNKELVEKKVDELQSLNKKVLEATVPKSGLKEGDVITLKAQVLPARDAAGGIRPETIQLLDLRVNDKVLMPPVMVESQKLVLPEDRPMGKGESGIRAETIPIPNGVKK